MITLMFTDEDYTCLLVTLGVATGGYAKHGEIPRRVKDLVDWTVAQGAEHNRLYWNDWETFVKLKTHECLREKKE